MPETLFLFGASGHAKVVAELATANGISVIAMFDDDPDKEGGAWNNIPVIGGRGAFARWRQTNTFATGFVSIGQNHARRQIAEWLIDQHVALAALTHPAAVVSTTSVICSGALVMPGAIINADARIGCSAIINSGAIVEHDCNVGDFVHIAPRATLCGGVTVGEATLVGAGTVIVPGVSIGSNVIIGAGSLVLKDIPDGARVAGSPCRSIEGSKC